MVSQVRRSGGKRIADRCRRRALVNYLENIEMEMVQSQIARKHANEVARKERFEFGKNWNRFLSVLDDDRILQAENSLKAKLKIDNLIGKSFLDIGSGSGLFSLAARRLGARVHSFDYDTNSVACTAELRRRHFHD